MEKSNRIRKIPIRSTMSDEELAAIIRRDRQERPQEFEQHVPSSGHAVTRFERIPYVCEVIAKWL